MRLSHTLADQMLRATVSGLAGLHYDPNYVCDADPSISAVLHRLARRSDCGV